MMSKLKSWARGSLVVVGNGLFHIFLGLYFYLDIGLCARDSVLASLAALVGYFAIRQYLPKLEKSVKLIFAVLAGIVAYLTLNPIPGLAQTSLLFYCAIGAFVFRVLFYQCTKAPAKWPTFGVVAVVSYALFMVFPDGPMRLSSEAPSVVSGEPLDVVIVGAGFSGIGMGIKLLDAGYTNFQIYESSDDIGGTWWNNQYPGLGVDVASDVYSYSFNPNPYWSRTRSPRKELHGYAKQTAEDFGVMPFIKTKTRVNSIHFNDQSQLWDVTLSDGKQVAAYHVFFSTGGQYLPKIPAFDGLADYQGDLFHTARWDHNVDLKGKRIAVIGSAASAIQIIPELAKVASQVDMYQRTPSWVATQPNLENSELTQCANRYLPMYQKFNRLRRSVTQDLFIKYVLPSDAPSRAKVEEHLLTSMREIIEDPELEKKLTPDYPWACKRPLVSANFYQTLNLPQVDVITEGVGQLTANGIISRAGTARQYDIVVMATGYKVGKSNVEVIGPQNKPMEYYMGTPETSYGNLVAGMPNFYLGTGLNRGLLGSFLLPIELGINYSLQLIRATGRDQLVSVRPEVQKAFNDKLQADLQETVWAGSCKSWYKTESGHIIANYPHTAARMVMDTCKPDYSAFEFKPRVK
ncbi:MAG: cation diffusion facilitator CzcD-associated flavoprotein CzcO [Pseudoalteromonas tetraodonis]|jgi:cation diffusion facilitator CzcD-associated flavoprotein CzcO